MNRDDIIRMAREAGWTGPEENVTYVAMLERFANLIAQPEQEHSEQWWRHEVSNAYANGYEKGRASVKQPEQEPVAYDKTDLNAFVQNLYDVKMREGKHGHYETMFYVVQQTIKHVCGNKQPAAWLCKNKKSGGLFALTREQLTELGYGNISMPPFEKVAPLYTAPPQRDEAPAKAVEWQGLTDEEILEEYRQSYGDDGNLTDIYFAHAIEAKLKDKNHAV